MAVDGFMKGIASRTVRVIVVFRRPSFRDWMAGRKSLALGTR